MGKTVVLDNDELGPEYQLYIKHDMHRQNQEREARLDQLSGDKPIGRPEGLHDQNIDYAWNFRLKNIPQQQTLHANES